MRATVLVSLRSSFGNRYCHLRLSTPASPCDAGVFASLHMRFIDVHKHLDDAHAAVGPGFSVGVHPWMIDDNMDDALDDVREHAPDADVLAIGECGLDRACDAPWHLQVRVFEDQIAISEFVCKPVIVHCVRAHDDVIRIRKTIMATQPWIMHGFNKGGMTIERVLASGCHVSYGAALLLEGSPAREACSRTPLDSFFLETDNDATISIEEVYGAAATMHNISIDELCSIQQKNFDTVFNP